MQQSTAQQRERGIATLVGATHGRGPLLATLAVGIIGLCALFLPEMRAAVEVWNASTAYSHCYLVLPMTLYLLWDRRAVFKQVEPLPEFGWVVLGVPITIAWLMAERLGIMEGRQLMAIAGFQLLFLVLLGRRMYWLLSGALLYLFFLVPFGAFLTPVLQRFTADFSIQGLNLLGIPNYSDNFTIETPAGIFFVAEACAGLRFLIAAVAFGVFYALLNYRSTTRRALFMAASIIVPIIANGFRALGIVVLGQILGSAQAAAADHILYGWLFFSIVMLLLVAVGHVFRETMQFVPTGPVAPPKRGHLAPYWGAIVAVGLIGIGPAVAAVIDARAVERPLSGRLAFNVPSNCARDGDESGHASDQQFIVSCGVYRFDVNVGVYPARATASAMVAERRRITQEIGAEDATSAPVATPGGAGVWTIVQTTDPSRVTGFASWVDGAPVRSGLSSRIAQARDSLVGGDYAPVLITVTTSEPARSSVDGRVEAMKALRTLISAQTTLDSQVREFSYLSGG